MIKKHDQVFMDEDKIILAAFFLFVILLVIRGRLHANRNERESVGSPSRFRFVFAVVRVAVLGVLLVYMVAVLGQEGMDWEKTGWTDIFLRCLIFIFTIYIFISETRALFRRKNKGYMEE